MSKWLDYFSIKQKLTLLLFIFLASVSYICIKVTLDVKQRQLLNINIEIVQQQYLIIEKFINAFSYARQQAAINSEKIDSSKMNVYQFIYEQNLKALLYGGKAYLDLTMDKSIYIAPIVEKNIKIDLNESQQLWNNLNIVRSKLPLESISAEQLGIFNHISDKLRNRQAIIINKEQLSIFNHISEKLRNTQATMINKLLNFRVQRAQQDLLFIQLSGLLILVLISLLTWVIAANITKPLNNIAKATSRIRLGDLQAYPEQNTHHDELGTMLYQADEMRLTFSALMISIQQHNKQILHSSEKIHHLSIETNQRQQILLQQCTNMIEQVTQFEADNKLQLQKLNEKSDSYTSNHELLDEYWKTVQETIGNIESIKNTQQHGAKCITHVKESAKQLNAHLENIAQVAIKTEKLTRKATIAASRSGNNNDDFILVTNQLNKLGAQTTADIAAIFPLLTMFTQQLNNISQPLDSTKQQLETTVLNLGKSHHFIERITLQIQKQQLETKVLVTNNEQQSPQLASIAQSLQQSLTSIHESEDNLDSSQLFTRDLSKISLQLATLLSEFKLDGADKRRRKGNDKRVYPRINNQLTVSLQQEDKVLSGLTQDLSLSGLQLKSVQSVQFNHHTEVTFMIEMPITKPKGEQDRIEIKGDVVHYEEIDGAFYYGVRFHSLCKQQKNKLQDIFDYFEKLSEFKS